MLNVMSNLPFLAVGVWGLIFLAGKRSRRAGIFLEDVERWPYLVFFLALALTSIGSGYYHFSPNNDTLVWDRLPLAVTFMGLFTAVLAERLSWQLATWLLVPLVALAIGSVLYWGWADDLRPYYVVQFFPMIALPVLFLGFTPRYTRTGDLLAALGCYVVAKILELLDGGVYASLEGVVSGHTLKHLLARLSAYLVLAMLARRQPYPRPAFDMRELGSTAT